MKVVPSLLNADFSSLAREVEKVRTADALHIDIMDGVFVPNISMGPAVVHALRDKTPLFFDVHLMLRHPLPYIEVFRKAGADRISFHPECDDPTEEVIDAILRTGAQAGVAIKPKTGPERIGDWGQKLSQITVMAVEPGFGGQKLMPETLEKIGPLKERFSQLTLQVDGGVNAETIHLCARAGADSVVAGTAVFQAPDPQAEIARLRAIQ